MIHIRTIKRFYSGLTRVLSSWGKIGYLVGIMLLSVQFLIGAGSTGSVTLSGIAEVGQTLSASNNISDPDGMGSASYQWHRNGMPIKNIISEGMGPQTSIRTIGIAFSSDGIMHMFPGWTR